MSEISPPEALQLAIEIVGGPSATARGLGIKPQAVTQWVVCPVGRVLRLEELTGGKISRHVLRPDFYPAPESAQ